MRLLDLFCGAGGAAMGYYRAGFSEIVGIDIKPQPRYPFRFVRGDALQLPVRLEDFDAIHASPPCQRYTKARHVHHHKGQHHPDLVAPVRDMLRPCGVPYVIENVGGAPLIQPYMLCGTMFGLKVFRHRYFETLLPVFPWPQHFPHDGSTGAHRGYSTLRSGRNGFICVAGHNFEHQAAKAAMGIDWTGNRHELAQAIPPAYTEFIGRQLIQQIREGAV